MTVDIITLAKAIRAAQERIERTQLDLDTCRHEQRGVRRTATHIADALPLSDDDKVQFLKWCGYGGNGEIRTNGR